MSGSRSARMRCSSASFLALREARKTRSATERLLLDPGQLGAALLRQPQQLVELDPVEGRSFGGALDLYEPALAGHHDVHVSLGADVLFVGQVQARHPVDDADRDGGDRAGQRISRQRTPAL